MKASLLKIVLSLTFGIGISVGLIYALAQTSMIGLAAGEALCVVPPGESTGPFTACQAVFTSVQDAVDAAVSGQQIRIATGVYTDIHSRNFVTQVVYLDKSVTLQGGYEAPFNSPPDPQTNPTTLDAEGNGRVIYIAEGQNATLIGLNLVNGNATDLGGKANAPNGWGGGVFAISATLTISQSTIANNAADMRDRDGTDGGFGGGIAVRNGELFLYDSTVQNNLAAQYDLGVGGGIAVENSEFHLDNNVILSNTAVFTYVTSWIGSGNGGGMAASNSDGSIINNQIGWNTAVVFGTAGRGGGLYFENERDDDYTVTIISNDIFNNVALLQKENSLSGYPGGYGGGIYIYYPSSYPDPTSMITAAIHANNFLNNTASFSGTFGIGGGIYIVNNNEQLLNLSLKGNLVEDNFASRNTEDGDGFAGGAAIGGAEGMLENNTYIRNTAAISGSGMGSAVYFAFVDFHSVNDVIMENNLQGTPPNGTVVIEEQAVMTMTNTVLIDNVDTVAIVAYGSKLHLVHPTIARNSGAYALHLTSDYQNRSSTVSLTNGLIVSQTVGMRVEADNSLFVDGIMWHEVGTAVSQSLLANVNIQNPFVDDPLFAPDGYHLTANSPARFAGVPVSLTYDVDGQGRPSANPSFGADEYWLTQQYLPIVFKSD